MSGSIARNVGFFTRIFTQFFGEFLYLWRSQRMLTHTIVFCALHLLKIDAEDLNLLCTDPKGIEGARKSMGLGLEEGRRKVKGEDS